MSLLSSNLRNHFKNQKAIKIIAGINNTSISQISKIAQAAELANASYIDIAANVKIVKFIKSFSCLPVCISSIEPVDIYNCVIAGADIIEVGNYDFFYSKGIYISSNDIIKLVKEIKSLVCNIPICVTVPYYLNLDEQVFLAKNLEFIGVDLLQTEGVYYSNYSKSLSCINDLHLCFSNSLSASLLSTYVISQNVKLPIITASGVTDIFTSCTSSYGASGVGIGSAVNKKKSLAEMTKYINQIRHTLMNKHKNISVYLPNNNI
uniref:Uncharacterized protein ycf23 n=1 Tax=Polysiphonia scopulorum TaxID=257860 RepID=A0A1Z1MHP4_9FLOR|nr:hypothetical protein [Polysiphonia scopulorum]ARW65543.1 hypothetical protein [Polysiphonia scopulorum]